MSKAELVWSKEDTEFLVLNYNSLSAKQLQQRYPSRSMDAIRKKARKLGLYVAKEIERRNRSEASAKSNWKGGIRKTRKGYTQILCKDHHRADPAGYVMEHILVWEKETGVPVTLDLVIHHLDGDKSNNDISNLCLMKAGAHSSYHNRRRKKTC